ncbi:hypothetical protein C5167_014538 [Papaver somniferum]|uniref:Uncharacterized protein n=1 Tax=Papaver somniferum TaxID=3469 RepID=A0A4Y7J6K3_PAPSO|nr:hypothetical protein C5167_014538 [Papaver somniferum]
MMHKEEQVEKSFAHCHPSFPGKDGKGKAREITMMIRYLKSFKVWGTSKFLLYPSEINILGINEDYYLTRRILATSIAYAHHEKLSKDDEGREAKEDLSLSWQSEPKPAGWPVPSRENSCPSRIVTTQDGRGAAESPTLLSKLHRFTEIGVLVKSLNFGLSSLDKWLSPKSNTIALFSSLGRSSTNLQVHYTSTGKEDMDEDNVIVEEDVLGFEPDAVEDGAVEDVEEIHIE